MRLVPAASLRLEKQPLACNSQHVLLYYRQDYGTFKTKSNVSALDLQDNLLQTLIGIKTQNFGGRPLCSLFGCQKITEGVDTTCVIFCLPEI